jgi:hypothetical protein
MPHPARHPLIPMLLLLLLALVFPGIAAHATCDAVDPLTVLPEDGACPGWVRDGAPTTAYSLEELMEIIDGMAMLYGQYGFVAAAFQNYAGEIGGTPTGATLAAFNQGSAENAQALYLDPESGWGDAVTDWEGTGAARIRIDFGYVTFQFWEECFFVSIVVGQGDEGLGDAARCLAEAALESIQGATPAAIDDWGAIKAQFR